MLTRDPLTVRAAMVGNSDCLAEPHGVRGITFVAAFVESGTRLKRNCAEICGFHESVLALVGCGSSSTPTIPPTTGDFIKNNDGVGTAQVFGIHIRVNVNSSGASTEDAIDANLVARGHLRITVIC